MWENGPTKKIFDQKSGLAKTIMILGIESGLAMAWPTTTASALW